MGAVVEYRNPNLNAIIFRESFPQLADLIRKSHRLYGGYPYFGKYNKTEHKWQFPINVDQVQKGLAEPLYVENGATIRFGYLINDEDVHQHQGQEYTFIGFDEVTRFATEYMVQYLITRLRSTDPKIRLRVWMATNPGGPGHEWFMKLFIGGECPHCNPKSKKNRKPYAIYRDARWSDGTPLSAKIPQADGSEIEVLRTTQFIPGNVTEHVLFGRGNANYIANLMMQQPSVAKALLDGCWALFEGQFFSCWDEGRGVAYDEEGNPYVATPDMRMIVPRMEVESEYWWSHFTGTDYGFSNSATASYLCMRTPASDRFPNGRIYVLDEYVEQGRLAEDVADDLLERWFLEKQNSEWVVPERPRSIQMWALSFDAFFDTGVKGDQGVSISRADQMNAKLHPYGMGFIRGANDRAGGWQHIYRMLRSGELVICDNCPDLIKAIRSRVKDPKKPDDILKVPGDKLDDCIDALRYAVYSWQSQAEKPIEQELAERMAGLDPTNAMIARQKFAKEIEERDAPAFTGGVGARRRRMLSRR